MSNTRWYQIAKTGEIDSYRVASDLTDFPRGVLLAYGDYITAGFKSRAEAEQWANEWHACTKCKASCKGNVGDACKFCGTALVEASR